MFYGGLSSRLCQLGTPLYIGKEHATPSLDPKLSGKSCHTTTRTNQYNEQIQTITLAKYRIDFKVATLTYKVLQTGEPSYLSSRISVDTPRHVLRSSTDTCRLAIPQFKTKIVQGLSDILLRPFGTVYHLIFVTHHPRNLLKNV